MSEMWLTVYETANNKFVVTAPDKRYFAFDTPEEACEHILLSLCAFSKKHRLPPLRSVGRVDDSGTGAL